MNVSVDRVAVFRELARDCGVLHRRLPFSIRTTGIRCKYAQEFVSRPCNVASALVLAQCRSCPSQNHLKAGAEGVIVAQGGNMGGWSLYAKAGKLKYCYNFVGIQRSYAESSSSLPSGEHQVRMEFAYDGGGLGKGGTASLYVDGKKEGEGKVPMTSILLFSADDGCDVGMDTGAPVSPDYGSRGNEFNGVVKGVQLAIAEDAESVDHLVNPEDAVHAMARQ